MTSPYDHPRLRAIEAERQTALAEAERLTALRDQIIRDELALGWRPMDLARATGVSRSRIDQIKNKEKKR